MARDPAEQSYDTFWTVETRLKPLEAQHASHGCSGTRHCIWVDRLELTPTGKVDYAEHIATIDVKACDGSCETGLKRYQGGFLHTPLGAVT